MLHSCECSGSVAVVTYCVVAITVESKDGGNRGVLPRLYCAAHMRVAGLSQALCLLSLIGDVLRHEKVEGGVAVFLYHGYVRRVSFYLYINRPDDIDRYT